MLVYFTGTVLSVLFAYISLKIKKYQRLNSVGRYTMAKLFALLSFVPLTAIMAFRYNVGTDYISYRNSFYSIPEYVENGYRVLNNILKKITNDPQSIFIISAIIICGSYFYIIYKESVSPVYSILLFVLCEDYFIAMNGMRQCISTAIILLSFPYIKEKKIFKSLIFLVIAFLFHKSSIVFIPLYILYIIEIPPLISGIAIIATYILSYIIREFVFPILTRFEFYNNYFIGTYANINENFNWAYTLIFLCFFILLSYEYKEVRQCKELKLLYSGIVLSLFITSLSAVMPTMLIRLTWHMNSFIVIYLPLAIKKLDLKISKTSVKNVIGVLILVAYALVTTYRIIIKGCHDVLPYQTIWSN